MTNRVNSIDTVKASSQYCHENLHVFSFVVARTLCYPGEGQHRENAPQDRRAVIHCGAVVHWFRVAAQVASSSASSVGSLRSYATCPTARLHKLASLSLFAVGCSSTETVGCLSLAASPQQIRTVRVVFSVDSSSLHVVQAFASVAALSTSF